MEEPSELLHRIKMFVLSLASPSSPFLLLPSLTPIKRELNRLTGVLEVGIFAGMALAAYFGNPDGTVTVRWQDGRKNLIGVAVTSDLSG